MHILTRLIAAYITLCDKKHSVTYMTTEMVRSLSYIIHVAQYIHTVSYMCTYKVNILAATYIQIH